MKKILVLGFSFMLCLLTNLTSCSSDSTIEEIENQTSTFQFQEPLLSWEDDQSKVMDYMTGFKLVSSSPYSLIYEGHDCAVSYLYAFTGKEAHLSYVTVAFEKKYKEDVKRYLDKNYTLQGSKDGYLVYADAVSSTIITTSEDSQFYLTYMSHKYMAR